MPLVDHMLALMQYIWSTSYSIIHIFYIQQVCWLFNLHIMCMSLSRFSFGLLSPNTTSLQNTTCCDATGNSCIMHFTWQYMGWEMTKARVLRRVKHGQLQSCDRVTGSLWRWVIVEHVLYFYPVSNKQCYKLCYSKLSCWTQFWKPCEHPLNYRLVYLSTYLKFFFYLLDRYNSCMLI